MADLVLRGMEMPTDRRVKLLVFPNGYVGIYDVCGRYLANARAVPLPEGHGRLIDADRVIDSRFHGAEYLLSEYDMGWNDALYSIKENAPTIVPAERGTCND